MTLYQYFHRIVGHQSGFRWKVSNGAHIVSESAETSKKWRRKTVSLKNQYEVDTRYSGYTTRPEIELCGIPTSDRFRDAINSFWVIQMALAADKGHVPASIDLRRNLWLDVSQEISRLHSGKPGALCSSGCWYSFEQDFALDGQDRLCLQGFPDRVSSDPDTNSVEKRRLAGEAYNLACYSTVAFAVYLNPWGAWWKNEFVKQVVCFTLGAQF